MRKLGKGLSVMLAMTLSVGLMAGCGANKTMEATYDYVAGDYIELGNYKGVEVELGDYTVTDEDLQNTVEQVLEAYMDYHLVDRAAQDGDKMLASFDAYVSGGKVEGFSGEDYEIVIGSGEFIIPGFEEALIGLKAGDKQAITGLRVPEDFAVEAKYAGREITFNVYVDTVYEPVLPTYGDDFVVAITDGEFKTTAEYDKELIRMLEENAVTNKYNDKYNAVLDKIVADTKVIKDFPAEYVESKMAGVQEEVDKYLPLLNISEEAYLEQYYGVKTVEEAAKNQILLEFIFQQIIVNENLTITEKYYEENLLKTAEDRAFSTAEKFVEKFTENGVVKCMLLDKAADLIMEAAVEK